MNKDKIIERVRKLLNLAQDDGAADGEITTAMRMANDLIAQYQIDKMELEAETDAVEEEYGKGFTGAGGDQRRQAWMDVLAGAIAKAVGSIGVYTSHDKLKSGTFGKEAYVPGYVFYGPESDVALAIELFNEWCSVIGTIATGRYGSPVRGAGRSYAIGFASALSGIANQLYSPTSTERGIVPVAGILAVKREKAAVWLESTTGLKIRKRGRTIKVNDNRGAYSQGRADGAKSGFGVSRTKSL